MDLLLAQLAEKRCFILMASPASSFSNPHDSGNAFLNDFPIYKGCGRVVWLEMISSLRMPINMHLSHSLMYSRVSAVH